MMIGKVWRQTVTGATSDRTMTTRVRTTKWSSNKKMDEIRAYGYDPERLERPDCLLHRLDLRLFPGFAGELQKYLGVKQYMPPSYLRASALLGRPIILSFWDHVSKAEVVNIREARLLHSMLSEDWEQADRAFVRDVDIHPALEPYRPATYSMADASTRALTLRCAYCCAKKKNDSHHHQRAHAPRQEVDGESRGPSYSTLWAARRLGLHPAL